jgi:DUF4097 and DUF4098 domain-containing protein YvlB
MNKDRGNIIPIVLYLILLSSFLHLSFASTARETFKKTISFDQGGFMSLSNSNGDVEIVAWDKEEVEIIAYKVVRASDRETAEKLLKYLKIEIRERDDEIKIETEFPKNSGSGFLGWLFGGGSNSFSVNYEIRVPQNIDLNIYTTNGGVEVEDICGRLRLESTNGSIIGRDVQGLAKCYTTNGSIKMNFEKASKKDKMAFKTTNGSIKLYFPDSFGAEADLKTTNGHIDCDFTLSGSSRRSKKKFSGTMNHGGHDLYCKTTNGNIGIYIN